jgi:hypothetical protein
MLGIDYCWNSILLDERSYAQHLTCERRQIREHLFKLVSLFLEIVPRARQVLSLVLSK